MPRFSHHTQSNKRRRLNPPSLKKLNGNVEEISFDDSARHEYLTGFHKRKVQRAKHAQEVAEKKAREEKIKDRKRLREERRADLQRHVEEVNASIRPLNSTNGDNDLNQESQDDSNSEREWDAIPEAPPPSIDHEAEYIDEEKYTTVTVEEIDGTKDGLLNALQDSTSDEESSEDKPESESNSQGHSTKSSQSKRKWTLEKPNDAAKKPKRKKRNFRYESKAERKVSRTKQRLKNTKQAKGRRGH